MLVRTHKNDELRKENVGDKVILVGWVAKRRNLGSIVFIDLRDRYGITQLVFGEEFIEQIKDVRNEYVLGIKGEVVLKQSPNPKLKTGEIEVKVSEVEIINTALTPPLLIQDETDALEELRLKYRYLDIRRNPIKDRLVLRDKLCQIIRNNLHQNDFIEVETPILAKSTPEGARDYLVPSRIYKGNFYALPQSPQIFKQLLMIGGIDRYFQIARCFRDEDLRADRQPEFTQVDIEMSFCDEEMIFNQVESLMSDIFLKLKNIELSKFRRISYNDAMKYYGSDKPDLRFDLKLIDLSTIFMNTEISFFKDTLNDKGVIKAIKINKAKEVSRKELDKYIEFVRIYGAKNIANLKYLEGEFSGSIAKLLSDHEKTLLKTELALSDNDLLLIISDKEKVANQALGALRNKLAADFNLINKDSYEFVWITDFPMFEYSESENRYVAAHHPFTSPKLEDLDKLLDDKANCYSRAYDLVLNGYELLSGSIRIHDQNIQAKVFKALGLSEEEAQSKFGFFLEAFKYGTPPHGGVGIGLERLIMILSDTENIKDVVAFPKTASAYDLMSKAPSLVSDDQLNELSILIKP